VPPAVMMRPAASATMGLCSGKSAAIAYTPVVMAQACMADALSCIDDHKITWINELLPWL
jgi:hypothetical protein